MTHVNHEALDCFDEFNMLHDGCAECEERANKGIMGVLHFDQERLFKLWMQSVQFRDGKLDVEGHQVSQCMLKMFQAMLPVVLICERLGIASLVDNRIWLGNLLSTEALERLDKAQVEFEREIILGKDLPSIEEEKGVSD